MQSDLFTKEHHTDEFKEDGSITMRISPTGEIRKGYKNDEFIFNIKDKELVVTVSEFNYDTRLDSQSTMKLRLYLKDAAPKAQPISIPVVVQKVADGVIKVVGEIAPPKDASIPVGVSISVGTILAGLLMFLGIRKIWV
jgi:hypothetical protein